MTNRFFIGFIGFISLISLVKPIKILASPLSGYAWSSNIGWIKFSGLTYGVDLDDETGDLSGYAWSSNIGWIKFPSYNQGREWAEWGSGLIKLRGANYGYVRNYDSCRLTGWVWGSDTIGWIRLSGNGYGVVIDDCSPVEPPAMAKKPFCQFSAFPNRIPKGGKTTLGWNCGGTADICKIPEIGLQNGEDSGQLKTNSLLETTKFNLHCSNVGGVSSFTAEVRVVVPIYCEIVPFLGTCR